ncbi:nicotinamide N-methyltransferase-like [Eublepharis macularius]|uniref:Nicotinamide N-methyltransferase-like n=1 Tax=Eublepharis macularius TaxID=481883 RepID=A0AA97KEY8_EUBMA|nr:nicotinamide N-methyltransferase-like [Eublepharis macularius]
MTSLPGSEIVTPLQECAQEAPRRPVPALFMPLTRASASIEATLAIAFSAEEPEGVPGPGGRTVELVAAVDKWAEKEAKLRRTLKQVLDGDVLWSNPLEPVTLPQADCLLDVECLEAACKDLSALRAALKNISSLLKLGGTLVSAGVLGCSFYMVGPRKFSFLVLTEEILRDALNTSGFAVVEFQSEPRFTKNMFNLCDYSGKYFFIARKEKEA